MNSGSVTIDLGPIVSALAPLLATLAASLVAVLGRRLFAMLGLQVSAQHAAVLDRAANSAAGLVYAALARQAADGVPFTLQGGALAEGVQHMVRECPDAIAALQKDDLGLQNMVRARLGMLLAYDPTVTVGQRPTA